jgi:Protein of unknown function (DUF3568)
MRRWPRWVLGGALLTMPLLAACQPIIVNESGSSVGSSSYVFGDSTQVHAGNFHRVWGATLTALQQLQITVESSFWDGATGKIVGRLPDTGTVHITVTQLREDATKVSLRIEPFGDQMRSEGIQARIAGVLQAGG